MSTTILCVDDDPGVTELLRDTLGAVGFKVVSAASVFEGIEIARTTKLDLIILDVLLPDVDGFCFLELVKETPNHKTPVIMASGCGTEDARNLATQRGAVAYLKKPYQIQQLLSLIQWAAPAPTEVTAG